MTIVLILNLINYCYIMRYVDLYGFITNLISNILIWAFCFTLLPYLLINTLGKVYIG